MTSPRRKLAVQGAVAGFVCLAGFAADVSAANPAWTQPSEIRRVEEYGDGLRVLLSNDSNTNPASCTDATGWIEMSPTLGDAKVERVSSVVMASFLSGRKVALKLSGTTCKDSSRVYYAVSTF